MADQIARGSGRFWLIGIGVCLPVLLFIADPGIFSDGAVARVMGLPALPEDMLGAFAKVKIFVYGTHLLGSLGLLASVYRPLTGWQRAFVGGAILTGGAVAVWIAIAMLPFTVPGLLIVVGALGLLPFLVAWVWIHHGVRLMKEVWATTGRTRTLALAAGGAAVLTAAPAVANVAWHELERHVARAGLAGQVIQAFKKQGKVDLRNVAAGEWDKIGFFWGMSSVEIEAVLGFHWKDPAIAQVGMFNSNRHVLLLLTKGGAVVDHVLMKGDELMSCTSPQITAREAAIFVVKGKTVCQQSDPMAGPPTHP